MNYVSLDLDDVRDCFAQGLNAALKGGAFIALDTETLDWLNTSPYKDKGITNFGIFYYSQQGYIVRMELHEPLVYAMIDEKPVKYTLWHNIRADKPFGGVPDYYKWSDTTLLGLGWYGGVTL